MDKFDRERQKIIIDALYGAYPNELSLDKHKYLRDLFDSEDTYFANFLYLKGHGLIECHIAKNYYGKYELEKKGILITNKGIDFIRNDGGLGAILNVVNVRLHNDTITKLESIIGSASDATEEEKSTLISVLRKLPEDAIKHLNLKLLDLGVSQLPHVFHAIQTALHSL